jgi:ribosomal protein S18 acetylase RimI-like enzyme
MPFATVRTIDHSSLAVAEEVHSIQMVAYAQEARLIGARYFPPLDRTAQDIRSADAVFLGAFLGGELGGALGIENTEGPGVLNIESLVVSPGQQRQGIGFSLLSAALELYAEKDMEVSTSTKNDPALRLYAKFGFVEYHRRRVGPEAIEIVSLRKVRSNHSVERPSFGKPQSAAHLKR